MVLKTLVFDFLLVLTSSLLGTFGLYPLMIGFLLFGWIAVHRISPMYSSAHSVAIGMQTNIYRNVRLMSRTMWLPLLTSCGQYVLLSLIQPLIIDADQTLLLLKML